MSRDVALEAAIRADRDDPAPFDVVAGELARRLFSEAIVTSASDHRQPA